MRVARGEAGREVGQAPAEGVEHFARALDLRTGGPRRAVAEEGAAPERSRGVDAAAPHVRQERAGAGVGERQPSRVARGDGRGAHRVPHLLELDGGRVRLAARHGEVAAARLGGVRCARGCAGAAPTGQEGVGLGVDRQELGPLGGGLPGRLAPVAGRFASAHGSVEAVYTGAIRDVSAPVAG